MFGLAGILYAMKRCLLFFLDGIGLGLDDPRLNPFAFRAMPALSALLGRRKLVAAAFASQPQHNKRASWLKLNACLGVPGVPQSATGQATLLTGLNIPVLIGGHDGPKPGAAVQGYLKNRNILHTLTQAGYPAALLNAYPPRYFDAIQSGYRLPGVIAMAAIHAGIKLKTSNDLKYGQALSADFTGQGWSDHLHIPGIPIITPRDAGARMAQLTSSYSFSIFEYWLTDIAGHHQDMTAASSLLAGLDEVVSGLLQTWNDKDGLILITSDHGNLEDLSTRRHTTNPVPLILIGAQHHRQRFLQAMEKTNPGSALDLTRVAPAIIDFLS